MQKTFTLYSDPAHGWVKVSKTLLKTLGIDEKISNFSYQRGEFAYLEEDCDASLLVDALEKRGVNPKFVNKVSDKASRIRNYADYVCLDANQTKELGDLRSRMRDCKHWSPKSLRVINNASLTDLREWQKSYRF
jgi:hypothetical protein